MNSTRITRGFLTLLLIFGTMLTAGEPRTFTSPDGRTIQAEIQAATPDRVTLKTTAGQTLVAPIDKFIPADQDHIVAWSKANPVQVKYRFLADYTKSKSSSSKRNSGNETITTELWDCNMKITNQSGQTLEGVTADYVIYFDNLERGNKITRSKPGKVDLGTMKNLQQLILKTEPIELHGVELQGGYYYKDGTRPRQKESITGMMISINHDGKRVFSWASSNVPKGGTTAEGTKGSLFGQ